MLKTYCAEISGSQLIWIDPPPKNLKRQAVLVVIDDSQPSPTAEIPIPANSTSPYDLTDLLGRLAWRGDALATQRSQRDAW